MKKLEKYSLEELEYKELVEVEGGNGGYQAGIPGYGEQVYELGKALLSVFKINSQLIMF